MKLFRKKLKFNNKGLSLVELICAVSIFSLAAVAIGSSMVVSAQNYSRGTYELDVQQEAQTTTNLIGDLLFDATGASFNNTVTNPVLKIQQEGIEYHITYNTSEQTLEYAEYVTGVAAPATGTLAKNVSSFNVPGLDATGDNFKTDKNVEIELAIEKNGRTYEADYSTTARNGAAESVGVAETAEIIIEGSIVLEPGQTYSLPYEVTGSILNKAISLSASSGISVTQVGSNIQIYVQPGASGSIPFTVSTIELKKDVNGNPISGVPLAQKSVNVQVRRVNDVTSPMDADNDGEADDSALIAGTKYKAGAEYRLEFNYDVDYATKVFGKAYDMDYVNPKQLDITLSMNLNGTALNVSDYIVGLQTDGLESPYVRFKLSQDMPNGSEIVIKATAKHPAGTNKTGASYDSVVDEIKIKYVKTLWGQADFLRGSDGVFIIDESMLDDIEQELKDNYTAGNLTNGTADPQNSKQYFMTIYELKDDGSLVSVPELTRISLGTSENMKVDSVHSGMLDPKKKYMYQMELIYYTDTSRTTPLWPVSPYFSEYYPLDAVAVKFTPQETEGAANGTSKSKSYVVTANNPTTIPMEIIGVNATRYPQTVVQFKVEKYYNDTIGWQSVSGAIADCNGAPLDQNSGKINYSIKFTSEGYYRITPVLTGFGYTTYSGSDATTTYDLTDSGYFYVHAQ